MLRNPKHRSVSRPEAATGNRSALPSHYANLIWTGHLDDIHDLVDFQNRLRSFRIEPGIRLLFPFNVLSAGAIALSLFWIDLVYVWEAIQVLTFLILAVPRPRTTGMLETPSLPTGSTA